jgi:hypothetical protein
MCAPQVIATVVRAYPGPKEAPDVARLTALVLVLATALAAVGAARGAPPAPEEADRPAAEGVLKPTGPPSKPPSRTDAGGACIVDLVQEYEVSGTLSGSATIDYRIVVYGPCGSPPGTFAEEWIAHGEFVGSLRETDATATFTYVARVAVGGQVDGVVVLGDGLEGELKATGKFADRKLSYAGWAR